MQKSHTLRKSKIEFIVAHFIYIVNIYRVNLCSFYVKSFENNYMILLI